MMALKSAKMAIRDMFWHRFVQDLSCETSEKHSHIVAMLTANAFGASMSLRAWF